MKLLKRYAGYAWQKGRSIAFVAVIGLAAVLVATHEPREVFAGIDQGLDSGNAIIDRTTVPGQTILKYQTTGNSTFKAPAGVTDVRVLVIGGGGGGGAGELNAAGDAGGGGGAGEYRHETSFAVTPGAAVTVTVGGGGSGSTTNQNDGGTTAQNGTGGNNSVFGTLTARGGGGGGGNDQNGLSGGSGGGGGGHCTSSSTTGGSSTAVSPGVGNAGGNAPSGSCSPRGAAGGGGAGAVGANGSGGSGGGGAAGLQNDIAGTNTFYAAGGGGGGGSSSGAGANGGSSIGGKGGNASGGNGAVGTANTGSGAGGGGSTNSGSSGNGGNGGSGTVIVRFATINTPDPGGVSGVRMWYKADSAGNTNSQWNDSSGLGHNLTQGTASLQPALTSGSINFNPAYVFDGNDDVLRMNTQGIGGNEPMSAFYAAASDRTDGGYRYFNEFGDDSPSISLHNGKPDLYVRGTAPINYEYSVISATAPRVYTFVSPNANGQSRIVGVNDLEETQNVTTGTYTTANPNGQPGTSFGNTNGSSGTSWSGPIAEAIYFNKVLTPAERLRVISYLSLKYATTRHQGTTGAGYADSSGTTIWQADSTFKNKIAGIGRDDGSTLNQKQSKSSDSGTDIVTIGHGDIAATNQANPNDFSADKSFLIWGHNGDVTTQNTDVPGTTMKRMDRIWKSQTTGTVGQVKVRIPSATLGGNNPKLLVSNTTTFDSNSQVVDLTTNGSDYDGLVTFTGTKYFTFASSLGSDIEVVSKAATNAGGSGITGYTPGQPLQYVITVRNNGPENAASTITVSDTLPDGIVPVNATGGGWSCPIVDQTVTCMRSALNSGITAPVITIEATIASSITGTKSNTASATYANDPDPSNNSKTLPLDPAFSSDLSLTKEDMSPPVAGNDFDYKFTVTNSGPSDVASYTITDNLPTDLTYVSASPDICGGSSGQSVTCTGGTLTNGQSQEVTLTVNVDSGYGGGNLSNTASVAVPTGVTDPNPNNNSATNDTNVSVSTDLTINKTHTDPFTAGDSGAFTINVTNNGPSDAPSGSVSVSDTLDEDFSYSSFGGAGWNCDPPPATTVNCTYNAVIANGGTSSDLTLTVDVDSIAKGTTSNTATVAGTTPDPNLANNSHTDTPVNITAEADLGITKAAVDPPFTSGTQEKFTFSVVNNGPSADTPTYTITDTLDPLFTFVSAEGDATCAPDPMNSQKIDCTGGGLAVGDPPHVTTITVAVDPSASSSVNNTATVAPDPSVTDPTPANDTSTIPVNFEPNADLSLTKEHTGNLTAGTDEDYILTTTNNGPSNVASYTITDTLDPNVVFKESTPMGACTVTGTSTEGGDIITCNGPAVANTGQDVITVTVTVEPGATPGSTIDNTATVAVPAGTNDPDLGNNDGNVSNTVDASADLEITKTPDANFVAGTNTNTFTIEVTNNGPSNASTFTVSDNLPAELSYVDGSGSGVGCLFSDPTVTCTGGPEIDAGQTVSFTLTVGVDTAQAQGSTINNTASVTSATPDPTPSNNSDMGTATVDTSADLGIEKTNAEDFTAGSNETYDFKITNDGPSDVTSFTVTDNLPAGLELVSSNPNICTPVGGTNITCTGPALPSGQEYNFAMTVSVPPGLAIGTPVDNTADVAPPVGTTDPNPANDQSTDNTNIVGEADLSATKAPGGTLVAGQTGQYVITVTNNGPTDVPGGDVTITDTLPSGMTYNSTPTPNWNCGGTTVVICTYQNALVNTDSTQLTLNVDIPADVQGEMTNSATVSSTYDDPTPGNDTGTSDDTVTAQADLTATKQAQGPVTAGKPVVYRFEIANNSGPSVANGVKITDDLGDNLTFQSVEDTSWSCDQIGTVLTCDLSFGIVVGNSIFVDITMLAAQDAPNPLDNTASVTFNGTDPTPANPSDSNPVSYEADLEVKLTHESKTYHSGDTVEFTYTVINHGPSAAEDVVLTDTLPDGLTFESIVASAKPADSLLATVSNFLMPTASAAPNTPFNCSGGQNITCNTGTLFGGTYIITMLARIGDDFTGDLTSMLSITSSTPDPNPDNNSSSDTILGVTKDPGLADTGRSILPWIFAAAAVIVAAVFLMRMHKRRQQATLGA